MSTRKRHPNFKSPKFQIDLEWTSLKQPPLPKYLECETWNLQYPHSTQGLHSASWDSAEHRILVVIDRIPTPNLHSKKLLSHQERLVLDNVIRRAFTIAGQWAGDTGIEAPKMKHYAWYFVAWADCPTVNMKNDIKQLADEYLVQRMQKIIKKLKPTRVHYFGGDPAYLMHETAIQQRGWVRSQKIGKHTFQASSNLSLTRAIRTEKSSSNQGYRYDIQPDDANLYGHAAENLARLLLGKYPYSLAHLEPIYQMVDTRPKWKKLLKKLWKAHHFSLDLETFNLTVHKNGIVTAQFSFDSQCSYILPLKCVDSPWTAKDIRRIYTDLQALFGREIDQTDWDAPYIIGQNLAFDFRVLCVELGLHTIQYRIYDTMAGAYALDENLSRLIGHSKTKGDKDTKHRPWALDAIFARFENDFYFDERFSKGNSVSIATSKLSEDVLKYCAMDSIAAIGIHDAQMRLAQFDGGVEMFKRRVLGIWSDTTHVISHFIRMGTHVDRDYVIRQHGADTSDIEAERDRLLAEFYATDAVREANNRLISKGPQYTSLFDGTEYDTIWLFDITKEEHKHLLFFDVLDLEPLKTTPTGKPAMDKAFKKHYGGDPESVYYVKEVGLWGAIEETVIVRSTIRAYYQRIHDDDGIFDDCVHASYGYLMVVTGRSNSFDPNMQNVPNHGQYAKLVKQAFCARPGHITIKADYSTHEVACWCQQSGDKALAKVFKEIRKTEKRFLKNPTAENAEKLRTVDVHRTNYSLFTGVPVEEVTKEQRQSSKGLTFGAIYGESVKTVAQKLGLSLEEMTEIHERFFGKFSDARDWLEWAKRFSEENLFVYNPLGHRRHLPGYLAGMRGVTSALHRRAQNSPIQGMASQLLFMAARLFHLGIIKALKDSEDLPEPVWCKKHGRFIVEPLPIQICQSVHDSLRTDARYEYAAMAIAALQYFTSKGLMEYTREMYGIEWIVHPRVDYDIGDRDDRLEKWDGTQFELQRIVDASANAHRARGQVVGEYSL